MTPAPCRYDPDLDTRVTPGHRDDCTNPLDHRACIPCTATHCTTCRRAHATNDHPHTCIECVGKIRDDLTAITRSYDDLADEAIDGARDGRLAAAAPIPGSTATILRGPATPASDLVWRATLEEDHPVNVHGRPVDPVPPLAVLTWWEDAYRRHHNQPTRLQITLRKRSAGPTVASTVRYLDGILTAAAQDTTGPDFPAFAREVGALRTLLEEALHNEARPERGVSCFECGEQLVRRFRDPSRCRHHTPERAVFRWWLDLGYPEALTATDVRNARRPCGRCDQGGIKDPAVGLSWECPGCRRDYTAGEYTHAVRRDLLEGGADGDGWTHIAMAAEAATTMTGYQVPATTVRKWMDRGLVTSCCRWEPGKRWGTRLVYWPDVAELLSTYRPRQRHTTASA